jgi:hypothetical protein
VMPAWCSVTMRTAASSRRLGQEEQFVRGVVAAECPSSTPAQQRLDHRLDLLLFPGVRSPGLT